jgi:hypothetical protein
VHRQSKHRTLLVLHILGHILHSLIKSPMMTMTNKLLCLILAVVAASSTSVSASVFLPYETRVSSYGSQHSTISLPTFGKLHRAQLKSDRQLATQIRRKVAPNSNRAAMAIPGYGIAEQGRLWHYSLERVAPRFHASI